MAGKTFFARHLAEGGLRRGFATAEVQTSETETPLHGLDRLPTGARVAADRVGAAQRVPVGLDAWLCTLAADADSADPGMQVGAGPGSADALRD